MVAEPWHPDGMISFIIPAHNEEHWIGPCLASICSVMEQVTEPYEVIVVDDASTDATPQIVRQVGVRTLRVEHRNIAAVRNSGARVAGGERFFFVDADTRVNGPAIRAALAAMHSGASGGGCVPEIDGQKPWWARVMLFFAVPAARVVKWAGGCFLFCTREAYLVTGGFSERLYAGEDLAFIQALKKVGRFVVLKPMVVTSGRKLDVVGAGEVIGLILRIAIRGPRYESTWVRDVLYGRRAQESRRPVKSA